MIIDEKILEVVEDEKRNLIKSLLEQQKENHIDAIIVFTGYGTKLVEHAAELWKTIADKKPMIFIVGPDSLEWQKNKEADAEFYKRFLMENTEIPENTIEAYSSADSKHAHRQAKITAERIKEKEWKGVFLVTAGYHLPRAYMTLVKALKNLRFEECKIIASPYLISNWGIPDPELIDTTSWRDRLCIEMVKIEQYIQTTDVAEWGELKEYLQHHELLIQTPS